MRRESTIWFELAEDDYENALLLWENRRYGATVFFCQQAVEKLLKAYIVEHKKKVPTKTHRIEVLIKEAGLNLDEVSPSDVTELSKAYIRVRYPDLNKHYYRRRDRVEPLMKQAKQVYLWVKQKLKKI
ncbi:HEPN domain-containing protein [Candidatus Gottesmanbacteria bacterium]|nr:HEPN domain-containing protein [Candidatus Gottesmanbacteria bacterium]